MSKSNPEQRYAVDLQTSRKRELLSPIAEPRRRSTFVKNNGESHAIELNGTDEMVVILERGGPDYAEGAVLISDDNEQTGTAFTLWKNGDNEILFIDPVALDPQPSAEEDFDRWEVVRQEEQAGQAAFTSEGFDITEDNGYIAGVDNGSPFALEFDSDNTPTKCHVWDEQKRKWCCLVQPLNPDYVTYLLTRATAISSAQAELRDRLTGVTVGDEEVKQLNPVLARMKEESSRRNQGHKWGRELSAQLSEYARRRDNKLTAPPVWKMRGQDGLMEHLPRIKGELPGLKDMQFIWGTSFCRADIKEVIQYLSLSRALEAEGYTGMKAAYFIDANAHTTGELLEATARDFNLDEEELIRTLNLQQRPLPLDYPTDNMTGEMVTMSNRLLLPPAFYDAPAESVFDSLQNANMGEVLDIWRAAAQETQGQTFGDWRIAVDRLSIRRLAEKVGADPDFIQVVSMNDIIAAVPNMTTRHVTTAVEDMWTRIKPEVQKGLIGSVAEDVDNDDMPMVFRLVLPDGRRIGINTQFRPIDLETREEVTDIPFAQEAAASIRRPLRHGRGLSSHTIQEAFSRYPMQFSGLGYYLFTKVMAESNLNAAPFPRMDQISMIIDDYEQSVGPTAAGVALRERHAVLPLSMPKGLVGIKTERQIDFDTTPDVSTILALPDSELAQVSAFIDSTAQTLRSDDIGSATGLVIDMRAGQVSEVTRIASRRQMLAISSIESNGVQPMPVDVSGLTYPQERILPAAIMALRPNNVNTVLTGYIGTHDNVRNGINVLGSARNIAALVGAELPQQLDQYHHILLELDTLLTTGEKLASEGETALTEREERAYWENNIKSQALAGIESSLGIVGIDFARVATMEQMRDYAQGLNLQYRTVAQEQITAEVRAARPENVVELNTTLNEMNLRLQQYQAMQQLNGLMNRISGGKQPLTAEALVRSINSSTNDFRIVAGLIDAYVTEKRRHLKPIGEFMFYNPGVTGGFKGLGSDFKDEHIAWAIQESQRQLAGKPKKVPDFGKSTIPLTPDDVNQMIQEARDRFLQAYVQMSDLCPSEKPIVEVVKDSGRFHPQGEAHVNAMRQRAADINLMADLQMEPAELTQAMKTGISAETRQQLRAQWEERLAEMVNGRMAAFNETQDQHWVRLNQQTQIDGVSLQTQLDRKQAIADRIHYEVIQPRGGFEAELKRLHASVHAEYRTWWNSVAKGLLKQGFPVSGSQN